MKISVLPLGSCRIHRPFHTSFKGSIYDNVFQGINIAYPKVGFFHSLKEIEQVLFFMKHNCMNLGKFEYLREYLFRKEPSQTTPYNIFDNDIIDKGQIKFNINHVDSIVLELSSLNYFYHEEADLILHWNPNANINISYGDIYPEGFYRKNFPDWPVIKRKLTINDIYLSLKNITSLFPEKLIIVTTHINDQSSSTRKELYDSVKEAVFFLKAKNLIFYDNSSVFEKFGYAKMKKIDIHHLDKYGEQQIGIEIQNLILERFIND